MLMVHLTSEWVANKLPKRPKDANKGTFGKVLVIAGSDNYPGAAYLCCTAAYRVGAGLVTLATIPLVQNIVSKKLPEVTFLSLEEVHDKLSSYDVLLIGPGFGQSASTIKFVEKLITPKVLQATLIKEKLPNTVIDGDGLNILSKMGKWWEKVNGQLILTPHPGEMSRLTGLTMEQIQSDREKVAIKFAKKWDQVVILKGANTVIASPAGEVAVAPFANPALATAGTGDVLSGMVVGFLAQGLSPFDASCLGVYIHGLAGEEVKKKIGEVGAVASDLLSVLPKVIKRTGEPR